MRNGTKGKNWILIMLPLLAVVLVMVLPSAGCSFSEENAQDGNELVMRTYTVAPEYGDELKGVLQGMFNQGGDVPRLGTVRLPREGLVVVTAPASMHAGIEEIIASLGSVAPTPPPTIQITYWAVQGEVADETVWPGRLEHLREALDAMAEVDGPMNFTLQEKIVLNSLSGSYASTDGPYFSVQQTATSHNGVIHAKIYIRKGPRMELRTTVRLDPGQLMVLEQAGFTTMVQAAPELAQTSTYLILQAEVVSGDGR